MSASTEFTNPNLVAIYDVVNPIDDKISFFLELAKTVQAKKIIDLGCGTGLLSHQLAKRGYEVIGVEPAAAMIEQAEYKYGNEARWVVGGAEKLNANMQADMTIMTGHVAQFFLEDKELDQALRDIRSATKPGGYLAFESRNSKVRPFVNWPTSTRPARISGTPLGTVEWWADTPVFTGEYASYTLHYSFPESGKKIVSDNRLRFRTHEAFELSLRNAGFTIEQVYGDWGRSPFQPTSSEMIFVAKVS